MAHGSQIAFVQRLKTEFPKYFENIKVLEVGSLNINGTVRDHFTDCTFVGVDVDEGPGVDLTCGGQDVDHPDNTYDTTCSCNCFEHNPYYRETIQNCVRLLKSGGMFLFTCATTGRPVHGVASLEEESKLKYPNWKTMPNVSRDNWDNDYYKNLTEQDIRECCDIEATFEQFEFEVEENHCDLYFWGIKK
jgi:SAM-dependent methyltransferase